MYTLCPSAPMRCAPVASAVNKFVKLSPRSQIMPPRPINEQIFYPAIKKLYPADIWKNWWPPLKFFNMVLVLWTNSATWL